MTKALLQSNLKSLPFLHRGKVRDIYAVGEDKLLVIQTDRLSAFDVILPQPIPGKGKELTAMSNFWFNRLAHVLPNHMTDVDPLSVVAPQERDQIEARAIVVRKEDRMAGKGIVMVVCAGTSDIPVAEEAVVTLKVMGNRIDSLYDVGVAGLHRLLDRRDRLSEARVIIVAAGMEGALPSVVGGLVSVPVIAVPTSVGYGTGSGGFAALLGMLNSCASNVTVVNIDNGFGAAVVASLINRQ